MMLIMDDLLIDDDTYLIFHCELWWAWRFHRHVSPTQQKVWRSCEIMNNYDITFGPASRRISATWVLIAVLIAVET